MIGTDEFLSLGTLESKARGLPELPFALTTHPIGGLRPPLVTAKAAGMVDAVVDAVARGGRGSGAGGRGEHALAAGAAALAPLCDAPDSFVEINELFHQRGWTDGLPIIPPTEEAVAAMLAGTDRGRDQVLGVLPPRQGIATVERVAINAVMAGCLPSYLPVVIAAVEAVVEPDFNLDGVQATTHPVAPLIIVNGPLARSLGINSGYNCFGQGTRANAAIGRALRLVLMNVGGGLPGSGDRSTQGSPAKYSYCIAEHEDANPWGPLHVERGFDADVSTVTVTGSEGSHNIQEHYSNSGEGILRTIAGAMGQAGSNNILRHGFPLLTLGPEHAATIAGDGYSKEDVKRYIFEHARYPIAKLSEEYAVELRPLNADGGDDVARICDRAEDILVIVAGGPGKHSSWQPTFGAYTKPVTKAIVGRNGTPVQPTS